MEIALQPSSSSSSSSSHYPENIPPRPPQQQQQQQQPPPKRRKIRHSDVQPPSLLAESQAQPHSTAADYHDQQQQQQQHDTQGELGGPFTIRPRADTKQTGSVSLKPIALIPRARIPLSWLDPSSSTAGRRIGSGRLFAADIPVLEKTAHARREEPVTLAARLVSSRTSGASSLASSANGIARPFSVNVNVGVGVGGGAAAAAVGSGGSADVVKKEELYVLERVTRGIYAVCALGSWVEVDDLHAAGAGAGAAGRQARRSMSMSTSRKPSPTSASLLSQTQTTKSSRGRRDSQDEVLAESKGLRVGDVAGDTQGNSDELVDPPNTHTHTQSQLTENSNNRDRRKTTALSAVDALDSSLATPANATTPAEGQSSFSINTDAYATQTTQQDTESTITTATQPGGASAVPPDQQQSPKEILENVRVQYLEILYASKSSVAYFAKGPLSRTRALFSQQTDFGYSLSDLAAFYRDCIIQIKRMDVKYRETLPATIKKLAPYSMEEYSAEKAKKSKKKSQKNQGKIARNGLYPDEEEYVFKWWKDRDLTTANNSTMDQAAQERASKRLVSELRLRETQLQILLILEAIAIEKTATQEPGQGTAESRQSQDKKGKPKKAQDLNILLDLLVDRLCIWCTVSLGDEIVADVPSTGATATNADSILHDFALEVVVPFYLSRLPEQCKTIARKLGVSTHATPRPRRSSTAKSKTVTPGTAVKRTKIQKPAARTLQRVLTDERAMSRPRARNFSRSTSDLHDLRRAQIDPYSSAASSLRDGFPKPGDRVVVDNREVDLQAVSKQHETKIKKMSQLAEQRKQLTAAIDALQRPEQSGNANDEQRRKSGGTASSRKSKVPVRNPYGQGVQVMATPKRGVKTIGSRTHVGQSPLASWGESAVSGQSPSVIPSSTNHLQFLRQKRSGISKHLSFLESSIQETPSKQRAHPTSHSHSHSSETNAPATPVKVSKEVQFRVPALPGTGTNALNSSFPSTPQTLKRLDTVPESIQKPPPQRPPIDTQQATQATQSTTPSFILSTPKNTKHQLHLPSTAFETPPRFRAERPAAVVTPLQPAKAKVETTTPASSSIYQSLGWDEGSDDELA